ncbi:response regulator [bacterium]|nr:response regulator [bacterium]
MVKKRRKPKILMMEDNIFLRKLYRDKLTREGFVFIEATNGIEGINKTLSEKPDLIILDLILPRKNGFDVLDDLRKDSRTKNIPVIVLSNLAQEIDIKEALARGAREYLVKTETRLEDVIKKIKKWLPK